LKSKAISVIIPVWKPDLEQLKKCLNSVVNQTYEELEIILVYRSDSQYDSDFYSLLEEYRDDKRLKVIQGKKRGIANSLNEGILISKGELIGRIDSDDYCDQKRFEKQIEVKTKNKVNIIGSWAYRISNSGKIIGRVEVPIKHSDIRKKMMFHCPMLHPTLLMDKKIFQDIGLYDPLFNRAEDYELFFRAMSQNYKFENVPEYLIWLRESKESITRGSEWKSQRRNYIRAKNKAFLHYGFVRPYDILYHSVTPLSYFVSPKMWLKINKLTNWYKKD